MTRIHEIFFWPSMVALLFVLGKCDTDQRRLSKIASCLEQGREAEECEVIK